MIKLYSKIGHSKERKDELWYTNLNSYVYNLLDNNPEILLSQDDTIYNWIVLLRSNFSTILD